MPTNFNKIVKEMEDQGDAPQSDMFRFPVGETKLRILTDFIETYSLFEGEYPNSKYVKMLPHLEKAKEGQTIKTSAWAWAQIIATKEGEKVTKLNTLNIIQLPFSLMKMLGALSNDPDWAFENFPMDYDLTIGNTGEGGARYSLRGSPKRVEVTTEIMEALKLKKPCQEIIDAILAKQGGKKVGGSAVPYPEDDIKPEDIPFN